MDNTIYIEYREKSQYPQNNFHPSKKYPEYRYGDYINYTEENQVYDMIRNLLYRMGLDKKNFGTTDWNPMGEYIKPGDNVLIKPNWVMNKNKTASKYALDCLVTHPSCLRAICDYCLIALKGSGTIVVGDAPMQDCDLDDLLDKARFNELLKFYKEQKEAVCFKDFRQYRSVFNINKVIIKKIPISGEAIDINLGQLSLHERRNGKRDYQVDNYSEDDTKRYQDNQKHIYSINRDVLQADVIINFCKPKSHRLAGFTAAMKNMVGITYDKASLPHRVAGAVYEGGDAYPEKSVLKKEIDRILEKKIKYENNKKLIFATIERLKYGILFLLVKNMNKAPYIKGIWHGNDTIWRTVIDLNYIVQFADKKGKLQKEKQRKILNFGDMIIAGDHNGPVNPEPKFVGALITCKDAVKMDLAICQMIGFSKEKTPLIRAIYNHEVDYLIGDSTKDITVQTNMENLSGRLETLQFPVEWNYKPHDAWKGIL